MRELQKPMSVNQFSQLRSMSVPYAGAIDLNDGTLIYVSFYISDVEPFSYKKHCIRIDKITHTVRKGDTLYSLARKLHTSVEDLVSVNNIKDSRVIMQGVVLTVGTESIQRLVNDAMYSNYGSVGGIRAGSSGDDLLSAVTEILGWSSASASGFEHIVKQSSGLKFFNAARGLVGSSG